VREAGLGWEQGKAEEYPCTQKENERKPFPLRCRQWPPTAHAQSLFKEKHFVGDDPAEAACGVSPFTLLPGRPSLARAQLVSLGWNRRSIRRFPSLPVAQPLHAQTDGPKSSGRVRGGGLQDREQKASCKHSTLRNGHAAGPLLRDRRARKGKREEEIGVHPGHTKWKSQAEDGW